MKEPHILNESIQEKSRQGELLERLYPHLNDRKLAEADDSLERYVRIALGVFEQVKDDPNFYLRLQELESRRLKHQAEALSVLKEIARGGALDADSDSATLKR